jgi:RNA polymerase sigma factor (sigma-70 family)
MKSLANVKSIDQKILIENCVLNKEWAQKELYDLYSSQLYPICCRYAIDQNEAKDILQEAFIRIFTTLKQYKAEGALIGWLKRVVVTTALNYIKKHKKHISKELSEAYTDVIETQSVAEGNITAKEIMEAFNQLPYHYRTVLGLAIIDEYSYKEISEILQLEESSCRTKVHRGKLLLQNILKNLNKITLSQL